MASINLIIKSIVPYFRKKKQRDKIYLIMDCLYSRTFNITPLNFFKSTNWVVSGDPIEFPDGITRQKYVVDQVAGDRYLNEDIETTRTKCLLLALATPIFHPIGACLQITNLAARILLGTHFCCYSAKSFKESLRLLSHDICRIALAPITLIGLEFAAIYGIYDPLNGRKFYATGERFLYHSSFLATCFQPSRSDGYKRVSHQTCLFVK